MANVIIDNFLKGLPAFSRYKNTAQEKNYPPVDTGYLGGETSGINPYRFFNCIAPNAYSTDANASGLVSVFSSLNIRSTSTGEAYALGCRGSGAAVNLYKLTGTDFLTVTSGGGWPHQVGAGSTYNSYDSMIVTINGTDYLIYAWDNNGAGSVARKLGIYDFSSSYTTANAADDSWATLSTGTDQFASYIPIVQGSDANIYIGSGYKVDKISTATAVGSAFSTNAVTVPRNYLITTMASYRGFIAIGVVEKQSYYFNNNAVNSRVFFWNKTDATFSDIIDIGPQKLTALYVQNGNLYAFISGTLYNELKIFTGNTFETVATFYNTSPNQGQVTTFNNMLMWTDGTYANVYGSPGAGYPTALNKIGAGGDVCKVLLSSNDYLYHSITAGTYRYYSGQGNIGASSIYYTPSIKLPSRSNISAVKVSYQTLASGDVGTLSYAVNSSSSFTAFGRDSGVISYALDGTINPVRKTFNQTLNDVDEIRLKFAYGAGSSNSCLKITRIEIKYEPTNKI